MNALVGYITGHLVRSLPSSIPQVSSAALINPWILGTGLAIYSCIDMIAIVILSKLINRPPTMKELSRLDGNPPPPSSSLPPWMALRMTVSIGLTSLLMAPFVATTISMTATMIAVSLIAGTILLKVVQRYHGL